MSRNGSGITNPPHLVQFVTGSIATSMREVTDPLRKFRQMWYVAQRDYKQWSESLRSGKSFSALDRKWIAIIDGALILVAVGNNRAVPIDVAHHPH
jgi:hypothetical protein